MIFGGLVAFRKLSFNQPYSIEDLLINANQFDQITDRRDHLCFSFIFQYPISGINPTKKVKRVRFSKGHWNLFKAYLGQI